MTLRVVTNETTAPSAGHAPRVRLDTWKRMEVEAARQLLDDLANLTPDQLAGPLGWYWLGRVDGAARNLLDILDSVATP